MHISGDNPSDKSMENRNGQAMTVTSEVMGNTLNKELKRFEEVLQECQLEGVEESVIQRFAAQMLIKLRRLGLLVAVDHVIFKRENGFINVVEADLGNDLNESDGLSHTEIQRRTDVLLKSVVDRSLYDRLENTMAGNAWTWPWGSDESLRQTLPGKYYQEIGVE